MTRIARILPTALICLLLPAVAAAERVESFDSVLTVQTNGVLLVEETIVYDFETAWRPGIFRDLSTRFERTGADITLEFEVLDITDEVGRSLPFRVEELGPLDRIAIGDDARLTTGRVHYFIRYEARGALTPSNGLVELAWHVNGTDWVVPIDSLSAEIHVPSLASSEVEANCLLGGYGDFSGECQESIGGALRFEAPDGVPAGSAMAVSATFPGHIIATPSQAEYWKAEVLSRVKWWMLAPIFVLLALLGRIVAAGRRSSGKRAATRAAPPARLRPAQAGVIWDERFDMDDVAATLLDLAIRGHIEISQDLVRQRSRLGARQFRMTRRTQPADVLEPYEELLIESIFELSNSVLTSDLRNRLYTELERLEDAVYDSVVPKAFSETPRLVQRRYGTLGGVLIVLGLFSIALAFPHAEQVAAALVSSGIVVLLMSPFMPARTRRGAKTRSELSGLRNHLELPVERTDLDTFESLLPFALVLGAADPWIGGFRGSGQRPEWFELSPNQPRPPRFADSLGRFAREVSLHIRTRPASPESNSEVHTAAVKHGGDW